MESFVTTVALIGIVIVIASLLSGAIERTGLPLVPIFLLLGAALGPSGLGITNVGFHSPALHALAMLGLALLLFRHDEATSARVALKLRKEDGREPARLSVDGVRGSTRDFRPSQKQRELLAEGHRPRLHARRCPADYGVSEICPRTSPPGKSPGPVLVGATPLSVCTFT